MRNTDFFQQLSLLIKAKLPLPEALEAMAKTYIKDRAHFLEIKENLLQGKSFNKSLESTGKYSIEILELIKAAEENDSLEESLLELSKYGHLENLLKNRTRDIILYPFFIIIVTAVLFGLLCRYALIEFWTMYKDIGAEESIPHWTQNFCFWVHQNSTLYFTICGGITLTFIIFYSGLIKVKPLSDIFFRIVCLWTNLPTLFNSSKLCSSWAGHYTCNRYKQAFSYGLSNRCGRQLFCY